MSRSGENLPRPLAKHRDEEAPVFICSSTVLFEKYKDTDLDYSEVYFTCEYLGRLKMITIDKKTIDAWYSEFIREGWTKKDFQRQYEAVKAKKVYNRVDLADWFETEKQYNEYELRAEVEKEVNRRIEKGRQLVKNGAKISQKAALDVRLYAADAAKRKLDLEYAQIIEEIRVKEFNYALSIAKKTEKQIESLSPEDRAKLFRYALNKKLIVAGTTSEKETAFRYLHKLTGAITPEVIKTALR